jgi:hypothetical protein
LKINNYNKSKNKIFIIWGLFIMGVIMVLLTLLFLSINNSQTKLDIQNHDINNEKEQQTYNNILNKIDNEVDKLTNNNQEEDATKPKPIIYYKDDGKTIHHIEEFNPSNGKKIKTTYYNDDGITIKLIYYNDNGMTFHHIEEFNPSNGITIKLTYYKDDGITIDTIHEFNPSNGKKIKTTYYKDDGITIDTIHEFDPQNQNKIMEKQFFYDGKAVEFIIEFNQEEEPIKTTQYQRDGTIKKILNF